MPRGQVAPVVLAAAAFYAAFTVAGLALHDWNPLWFVWIGERFSNLDAHGRTGYDGQFVYYIARDGWMALPHVDNPPYRMQRILYPLLVRWVSLGAAPAMPWAMVAINAAAIVVATYLITRWLAAHAVWAWYGLVYPLFIGTVMAYSRDLTEPLSCALALAGVACWLDARRVAALGLLILATLTRETTALFIAALAISESLAGRWRRALALAATLLPLVAWQVYLSAQLGRSGLATVAILGVLPARYMFTHLSLEPGRLSALLFISLPAVALGPWVVRWLASSVRDPIAWLVAVHWAFLLFAPPGAHLHVLALGRQAMALVLTLLLIYPRCAPALRAVIAAVAVGPILLWVPVLLWWAPWTAKF
jgi:hypothetical protein